MKLIFDTNAVLDIFVFNNEETLCIWRTVEEKKNESYCSQETILELKLVLSRPVFKLTEKNQQGILETFLSNSKLMTIKKHCACRCKDPEDQKFLDLATNLASSKLITRDKRVLKCARKLRKYSVEIQSPHQYSEAN